MRRLFNVQLPALAVQTDAVKNPLAARADYFRSRAVYLGFGTWAQARTLLDASDLRAKNDGQLTPMSSLGRKRLA